MREDELQALFLQEDSYCAHINPKKLSIGNFEDNVPDERSNT